MIKMRLKLQKRLASKVAKASRKRIRLDSERLEDIKEAITKADIRGLLKDRAIIVKQKKGVSRARISKKRKPLKKGKSTARLPKKIAWMNRVRALRKILKTLRDKGLITSAVYQQLYLKTKGGFFRTKRHLRLYIDEKKLLQKGKKTS